MTMNSTTRTSTEIALGPGQNWGRGIRFLSATTRFGAYITRLVPGSGRTMVSALLSIVKMATQDLIPYSLFVGPNFATSIQWYKSLVHEEAAGQTQQDGPEELAG
jgi:hypothetical protein